ncbi:MAG TPA: Ig-like domain-containing protein [Gemmatimonadota bacterium]|jgi:hypothetical protein
MSSRFGRTPLPVEAILLVLLVSACSGSSGPEPTGLLRVTAADLDGASGALAPSGFEVADVSSFRIQLNRGPTIVVDSTFVRSGGLTQEFELRPDTYVVLVEAFQGDGVLLFTGVGQTALLADDTTDVAVDLDPSLGDVEVAIGDGGAVVVPTNGTAPIRVTVRNSRGQPVAGARLGFSVVPSQAADVRFSGAPETGPEGTFQAVLDPAGFEGQAELRLTVDGIAAELDAATFSIVSPVDVQLSEVRVSNGVRLSADGLSAAGIEVTVVDAQGAPLAGIPVVVQSSRNTPGNLLDRIQLERSETDAAGRVEAALRTSSSSSLAGDATIRVFADGKQLADTGLVTFRSIVDAVGTRVLITPTTLEANGIEAADVLVEVSALDGGPASDVLVQLATKDDSLFRIQPSSTRSNAQGEARFRISSTVATGTFVDVIADGLRTTATGFVLFN